jgi:GNAT superfamily N-acetyltransferase
MTPADPTRPSTDRPDLRALADRNEAAGYDLLLRYPPHGEPREARRFGGCVAYPAGRRSGFFNPVLIVEPATGGDVQAAVEWMHSLDQRLSLRIREDLETDGVRRAALGLGLERAEWIEPVMTLWPLRPAPALPPGVSIEAADASSFEGWYRAAAADSGGEPAVLAFMRELLPPGLASDPDVRFFSGLLDGEPVASSVAIRSGEMVGVYVVGTATRARRRGIGSAMTWRVVEAGREWGCVAATLQASAMGEPVYRSMGFERVTGYVTWKEPKPSSPPG